MEKNICIVHYNTPELTKAAVYSILKNTPDANITVFDNSDRLPFEPIDGVCVIDNTKGQIIDFNDMLSRHPDKVRTNNDWGSAKHCYTVQKLWSYFPDGFVLMDSDVLVKKDISTLFDESVAYAGSIYRSQRNAKSKVRLLPFLCWINVRMCSDIGINYFDHIRNWKLNNTDNMWYDTGASFLEDCRRLALPFREIDIYDFIIHFGGGHRKKNIEASLWLERNKNLYDNMEEKSKKKNKPVEKYQAKPSEADAKDKYLVVIPYFAGGSQGRELEYAIAGWRRHFKEPYLIVLVGDYHPVVDTGDDIVFIESERVPEQSPENYRCHIDFVKKFKKVRARFPESKGFIFVADDCYAVNDFDIYDVMVLKQNGRDINGTKNRTAWERERCKTKALLQKEEYPTRNFTTHLPTWIEWDKLEALWEKYDMEHNSYIFEDLYFNIYYPHRIPLQLHIDFDNFKCGVYRPNPRIEYIERAFRNKIWIQNSVEGWIPALDKMLSNYYGI